VLSSVSHILHGAIENLSLLGGGDIAATGNALANGLVGNGGANLLRGLGGGDAISGGQGADTIEGGLCADTLTGGGGADLFLWLRPAEGGDAVAEFRPGEDRLAFVGAEFGGLAPGAPGAAHFANNAAGGAAAQFVYTRSSGLLEWDADGAGAGAAVIIATLSSRPALAAADIVLLA
jgi:Ca2+-binding RTX toxin-like protein